MCGTEIMNCVLAAWLASFEQNPAVFYWHLVRGVDSMTLNYIYSLRTVHSMHI
jgi:hypothetical protein